MDYYFTKDDEYLTTCPENITFRELHFCSEAKFHKWVVSVSKRIKSKWHRNRVPILPGRFTTEDIVADMKRLSAADTTNISMVDDLTHREDCISSTSREGKTCTNFFPTMWLTTDGGASASLYDMFVSKKKETTRHKSFRRHFRRDGFYVFSNFATKNDKRFPNASGRTATTGSKWIVQFYDTKRIANSEYKHLDYWLEYQKTKRNNKNKLTLDKKSIDELRIQGYINQRHIRAIEQTDGRGNITHRYKDFKDTDKFYIRVFDGNEKVFTTQSTKIFRMGFSVFPATNFPPVVAKHIYQNYTEKFKKQKRIVVYDPSAGWGGRLLGACAAGGDRHIHYVGTDPNKENYIDDLGITRYEYLADFYQRNVPQENHITYDIYQEGSEEIHKVRRFHKYKGKIDLVFTSPPYFDAEGYSKDDTQSSVKYPEYQLWVDGFLRPTLETACKYLKVGGYLIWNIADVRTGSSMFPLEMDTVEILTSLKMKYENKRKFVLQNAPGGSRVSWVHRMPQTKNFVSLSGKYRKYEPIFIFRKTSKSIS